MENLHDNKDKKLKVILVDDDADDRHLFAEALHEIIPADLVLIPDGTDLLKILENTPVLPDLIFLDLRMTLKHGEECLVEIKTNPRFQHIPVIILSGSQNPAHIERVYAQGANLFIHKPRSFDKLKQLLAKVLEFERDVYVPQAPRENFMLPSD